MGFAEAVASVLGNYATFSGRARRSEFWYWWLAMIAVGLVFAILAALLGDGILGTVLNLGYFVFSLAVLVPTIAVAMRRLHDSGKTGWLLLLALIPIVNLLLLVFYVLPSDEGSNQYGPQPG
jgi:uncharacterized membrane protein YhaH (DUF805 family)